VDAAKSDADADAAPKPCARLLDLQGTTRHTERESAEGERGGNPPNRTDGPNNNLELARSGRNPPGRDGAAVHAAEGGSRGGGGGAEREDGGPTRGVAEREGGAARGGCGGEGVARGQARRRGGHRRRDGREGGGGHRGGDGPGGGGRRIGGGRSPVCFFILSLFLMLL
jgi:hypothetical protein